MMRIVTLFLLIFFTQNNVSGQTVNWSVLFNGIADNREYFNPYTEPGTIAGTRIAPELSFSADSRQTLYVGISYMYEFGSPYNHVKPQLNLHYAYTDSVLDFKIGVYPRKGFVEYPQVLLIDTLNYYRPNLEGAFVQLKTKFGKQYVWFDWIARQDTFVSERFLAGTSGKFELNNWFIEDYIYMYHKGGTLIRSNDRPVRDNGGSAFYIGRNFDSRLKFSIKIGYISSYNRMRMSPYRFFYGGSVETKLSYKFLGLDFLYYRGTPQLLKYGDWFYRSGNYARADAYLLPINSEKVTLKVNFAFHYTEKILDMSQHLLLSYRIDGRFTKH